MKILYGVPSEGMGHATRSQVVVEHLLGRGHDVSIATSDRAFEFLEKTFPGHYFRIEGLHLAYEDGGNANVDGHILAAGFTTMSGNDPANARFREYRAESRLPTHARSSGTALPRAIRSFFARPACR
jgi:UDP:flavonoid glycosyltransferase YjiC (YdhE family)